jgi:hypothetical protein
MLLRQERKVSCSVTYRALGANALRVVHRQCFVREPHEFGKRRVRPARSTRECRDQAGERGPRVTIDGPQVDRLRGSAGRTAHPQEPMPDLERAADRQREQHRHALRLPLVLCGDARSAGVFATSAEYQ